MDLYTYKLKWLGKAHSEIEDDYNEITIFIFNKLREFKRKYSYLYQDLINKIIPNINPIYFNKQLDCFEQKNKYKFDQSEILTDDFFKQLIFEYNIYPESHLDCKFSDLLKYFTNIPTSKILDIIEQINLEIDRYIQDIESNTKKQNLNLKQFKLNADDTISININTRKLTRIITLYLFKIDKQQKDFQKMERFLVDQVLIDKHGSASKINISSFKTEFSESKKNLNQLINTYTSVNNNSRIKYEDFDKAHIIHYFNNRKQLDNNHQRFFEKVVNIELEESKKFIEDLEAIFEDLDAIIEHYKLV